MRDELVVNERRGKNQLMLFKLGNPRKSWAKSPLCHYGVMYYWHRSETENSVLGEDWSLWTTKEVQSVLDGEKSLFDICAIIE